mgnify:CR=1
MGSFVVTLILAVLIVRLSVTKLSQPLADPFKILNVAELLLVVYLLPSIQLRESHLVLVFVPGIVQQELLEFVLNEV